MTFALWVMYCRGAAFSEFFLESVPSPTPWLYFCKYLTFPCERLIESTYELLNCSLLPLHYSSLLFPKHLFMQENKLHVVPLENPRTFHHRGPALRRPAWLCANHTRAPPSCEEYDSEDDKHIPCGKCFTSHKKYLF